MSYPTEAQRRRLERFPDRVAVEDLRACFALSDDDRRLVFAQRGASSRLGLAVAVCALRFLGFVPDDIASIPDEALAFVAGQVDAAPHELLAYGARAQTRSDHLNLVLAHLDWRRVDDADREHLAGWLVERAVEHDAPATLIVLVAEHLRARQMLRPPVDALARMIATARGNAHRHVERLLADQLAPRRRGELDTLLAGPDGQTSGVADLRRRAARTGVKELLGQAQQYRRLVALGAPEIDVSAVPPARRRAWESLGRRMTAQQLRRLEPARRHPLLVVLLQPSRSSAATSCWTSSTSCCASATGAPAAASTTSAARPPASATNSRPSDITWRGSCWSAPPPASCPWTASAARSAWSDCTPQP